MKKLKVLSISDECAEFEGNVKLYSEHEQDCCESHYLSFNDLTLEDFEGLTFDMTGDGFFRKIDGYGIELIPNKGHSIKIPGYGSNNGYYSSELTLVVKCEMPGMRWTREFDISECQEISE